MLSDTKLTKGKVYLERSGEKERERKRERERGIKLGFNPQTSILCVSLHFSLGYSQLRIKKRNGMTRVVHGCNVRAVIHDKEKGKREGKRQRKRGRQLKRKRNHQLHHPLYGSCR